MARSPPCVSPVCLQPLPPAWLLGSPHRPPESPRWLTCPAWWCGDLDAPRFAFPTPPPGRHGPGSLLPSPPKASTHVDHNRRARGDAASPRGGRWPVAGKLGPAVAGGGGGEARDQGLQQGTRLKEVDCSRSPDLFPHSPCPSSQHRHHGTSTSGRSKGCPVRGGEVSPGGSSAAAESKPPGWPDVRASAGGHQWGQRVSQPLGVGAEEEGEPGQRPGEAPKPCCWAAGRLAGWRGQKAWAGRGDRARLGLDGAAGLAWAPRRRGKGEASELRASAKRGADALGRSVGRQAERKKKGFPDRESNPGRGGESAES